MVQFEPNQTLYVHNLNEKINKNILKKGLYAFFSQYGRIIEIVALRGEKMRGQAWVVFDTLNAATSALKQAQSFLFFDKPLVVEFAKEKSDIIAKKSGKWKPREKRARTEKANEERAPKVAKQAAPPKAPAQAPPAAPQASNPPNKILFATGLPAECTSQMLDTLFTQFHGYQEVRMVPGKQGISFIEFADEMAAGIALQGLNGFKLTSTDLLQLSYAKK